MCRFMLKLWTQLLGGSWKAFIADRTYRIRIGAAATTGSLGIIQINSKRSNYQYSNKYLLEFYEKKNKSNFRMINTLDETILFQLMIHWITMSMFSNRSKNVRFSWWQFCSPIFSKRMPNNLLVASRKRKFPLVILNAIDDAALTQEIQKSFVAPNARKRRSSATVRNVVYNLQDATTMKPIVRSTFPEYTFLSA